MPDGSGFLPLDALIARADASRWSERDATLALRRTCGMCEWWRGSVVPRCEAFNRYATGGESALACPMFTPALDDDELERVVHACAELRCGRDGVHPAAEPSQDAPQYVPRMLVGVNDENPAALCHLYLPSVVTQIT